MDSPSSIWRSGSSYSDKFHVAGLYTDDLCHTTAVQALLEFGFQKQEVMGAVKQCVQMKGNTDFNSEDILKILQERHRLTSTAKSHIDVDSPSTFTHSPLPERSKLSDRETDSINEENRKLEENKTCKICLEQKVNIVFLPCGHICSCSRCSPSLRRCAICREFIQNALKIQIL